MINPILKPGKKVKTKKKKAATKIGMKAADKMFSIAIRRRDGKCMGQPCRFPDKGYALQCSHFLSRSYHATRCDFDNANALCAGCHSYYTPRPLEFEQYLIRIIGQAELDRLKGIALAYIANPYPKIDWAEKYAEAKIRADDYA